MLSIVNINHEENLQSLVEHAIYNVNSINVLFKNGFIPNIIKFKKLCYFDVFIQLITNFKDYTKEEQISIINKINKCLNV